MDIKIKYTCRGEEYIKQFNIYEDNIILRLRERIKEYNIPYNKTRLLVNKIRDIEGVEHSIYGYLYMRSSICTFEVDMISTNIATKKYDSNEILQKAKRMNSCTSN